MWGITFKKYREQVEETNKSIKIVAVTKTIKHDNQLKQKPIFCCFFCVILNGFSFEIRKGHTLFNIEK